MTTDLATKPEFTKEQLKSLIVERLRALPEGRLEVENRLYQKAAHDLGLVGFSVTQVRNALDSLGFGPDPRVKRSRKTDSWAVLVYQLAS